MTKLMKIAPEERRGPAAVAESGVRRRLAAQWYRDAEGVLAIHWAIEVELDDGSLPAALAA
jgi:hypothetical protein